MNYCILVETIIGTKTYSSLKIDHGLWHYCKQHIGGKNAIDFFVKMKNMSFIDAVNLIQKNMGIPDKEMTKEEYLEWKNSHSILKEVPQYISKTTEQKLEEKQIILPPKSKTNKRIFAYLRSRCIDKDIINYCIDNNLIYEDEPHHNVVFLGYDDENKVRFGCVRAANATRYMHDLKGSSKMYSFKIKATETSNSLHIFESAIDLLSYATLVKMHGMDFKQFNYISLSGVYQCAEKIEDSKVPIALKKFLESNKNIKKIVLHLDNDEAGRGATKALQYVLEKDYEVIDSPSTFGKDINDFLCHSVQEKEKKSRERER